MRAAVVFVWFFIEVFGLLMLPFAGGGLRAHLAGVPERLRFALREV